MDMDKLKYIITVAEEKNFTRAAKKLYVSQPALSKYISNLEDEMGVKIFDRDFSPIKITSAGERFLQRAREIIDLKNTLWQEMADISEGKIGSIKIGIVLNRSPYIIPAIIPRLTKEFPQVKIMLEERSPKELEELLHRDQLDMAVLPLPLHKSTGLAVRKLQKEELVLVTAKNEKYEKYQSEGKIFLKNLEAEKFILMKSRQHLRTVIDDYFYKNNFEPNIFLESESMECILCLVEEGMGISFVSRIVAESKKWKEKLIIHELVGETVMREYAVVHKKGKTLTLAENEILKELTKYIGGNKN